VVDLLLFWHAPLGVHNAVRRHQPPQRTVLSQVDCFVQCEVVGSQVSKDVFNHVIQGRPSGLFQLSGGEPLGSSWHLVDEERIRYATGWGQYFVFPLMLKKIVLLFR